MLINISYINICFNFVILILYCLGIHVAIKLDISMGSGGCAYLIKKACHCLTCGGGEYVVRFIHTAFSIGIPSTLLANKRSGKYTSYVIVTATSKAFVSFILF